MAYPVLNKGRFEAGTCPEEGWAWVIHKAQEMPARCRPEPRNPGNIENNALCCSSGNVGQL